MLHKGLLSEARANSRLLLAVVVLAVLGGGLVIGQAWLMAAIINAVFLENAALAGVSSWLAALAVLMFLRAVAVYYGERMAHRLADCIKQDLRQRVITHLLALGPVPLARQASGDLVNVLTEGIENLEAYFARYLPQLITAALVPAFILGFVVFRDVTSAALMLVTAPLIPFFMLLIGRAAEKLNKRQWEKLSRLSAHFLDVLEGLTTLKLFGRSKEQITVIARMAGEFRDTTLSVLRIAFLSALTLELFATISTALVAVMVGVKLLFWELNFFDAFFVLLLAPDYYLPLRLLGTHFHSGMAGSAAAAQIYQVLAMPLPEHTAGSQSFPRQGSINLAFEEVHFAYDDGTRPALAGVTFAVQAGEKVALVGSSGAGKSTIAALLLRFIEAQAGCIKVNGQPLTNLATGDWLAQVSYVPQNPHLFSATVADNIAFGFPCNREEIEKAAEQAGAHRFITQLPEGYDTVVGEGGRCLSGGERQRLAIARALLRDAPVVILDEATANLDPRTEALIQEGLDKLLAGRTALIIAHRLTTVYGADRIIVLREGQVVESGKHEALLAKQGDYCQMVAAFRGSPGGGL